MYKAFVQMPLVLYQEKTAVVEAEIELADEYVPMAEQWIFHPLFRGLMPLGPVVYDGERNAVVLTTKGTVYDFTMTLEEWLRARVDWHEAAHPYIETGKKKEEEDDL
jgi:hypothetical protein